jgi:hypothetical protein
VKIPDVKAHVERIARLRAQNNICAKRPSVIGRRSLVSHDEMKI